MTANAEPADTKGATVHAGPCLVADTLTKAAMVAGEAAAFPVAAPGG